MNKTFYITFCAATFAGLFLVSCTKEISDPPSYCETVEVTYTTHVGLIINNGCAVSACHDAGSSFGDFTTHAGVKSKVDDGSFNTRVLVNQTMPPSGPLDKDKRDQLQCWLDDGAPDN